ncbi:hypothetical protein PTKIN_Ptkin10aG0139200 [Pterospermum kingtungense]
MTMSISKVLTKSDIEKSLLISAACCFDSNILPLEEGHFYDINVIDNTGKAWSFPCFIQQISEGMHMEPPVLSVGWLKFVCDKDVRVGDMVFLHQKYAMDDHDDDSTCKQLKIEVKRKIRLMGEDIWAAVE